MKKLFFALTMTIALFSCDKDEQIIPKDYGMKTFEADLKYDSETPRGEVAYKQQTYFAFGNTEAIATAIYDTEDWTEFNVFDPNSDDYNDSTDVQGWDLVFTYYTGNGAGEGEEPVAYGLTGALHNTEKSITVAEKLYEESTEEDQISQAFADVSINDISSLDFNAGVETIGRDWKEFDMGSFQYKVLTNKFYFVKVSDSYYKLRFKSFYGESTSERIIKIEYALMQ